MESDSPRASRTNYYSTPDGPVRFDPQALTQGLVNQPTLGRKGLVAPATAEGTLNEATPNDVHIVTSVLNALGESAGALGTPFFPSSNFVNSYLTTDQNGTPEVVNVTQPGHG
jgi:hypothetical protein